MAGDAHEYEAKLIWEGNTGEGTATYTSYGRNYRVLIDGKPELVGTADPAFRGQADLHNPEDLFVTALSACHMLTYLALCAKRKIRVLAYEDEARGTMVTHTTSGGKFEEVTLRPRVTVDGEEHVELATRLHDKAHELCFIAASCSIPIRHQPTVSAA